MSTTDGAFSLSASLKEEKFDVGQDLFDLKTIINKVETGKVSEPEIPTKSSTEILSELFGAFNAEPPKIPERVASVCENGHDKDPKKLEVAALTNKKIKKNKKKHKHKEKKHKKKAKSSKKPGSSEDSEETNSGRKKHKHAKKKHTNTEVKETESKIMPATEAVSVKIITDESNNVKRTVELECTPSVEASLAKEVTSPVRPTEPSMSTQVKEVVAPSVVQPNQRTDTKPKVPGKIVIKNLKFSSVFEETVRQVEEQAKLKAERFEEGEISDDSSPRTEKEPSPVDLPSPEHIVGGGFETSHVTVEQNGSPEKKERHKRCRKHSSTENKRHHHHHRHRSRSRSHDKDQNKKMKKTHSGGDQHHHSPHRDGSRSHHSKKRSRSRSRGRKRSLSRGSSSGKRRSRSRGSSGSRKRSRRSRSRHRSQSPSSGRIDKQKLLEIARKNAMNLLKQGVLPSSVVTQDKVVAIKAGGKSVAELTDFCKQLSKKEALGQVSSDSEGEEHPSSGSDTERPFHHPFQIKERPASIVMNIRNSVQLPVKTLQEKTAEQSKQLRIQFPVSSGQQHRKSENQWVPVSPKKEEPVAVATKKVAEPRPAAEPVVNHVFPNNVAMEGLDIGSIVSQRLTAMRKLQENPNDVQALSEMHRAQKDMQMWAESKQQPGQFTGSTGARVLSAAELASGYQAWAKKDQLTTASPVSGGMGMALLQKMGWRPGEGLGKNKEGTLEPLKLEIKMDKKGLVSQEELGRRPIPQLPQVPAVVPPQPVVPPTSRTLVGKHPVSLLVEFCSKRRWGVPQFDLCFECGPDHRKNFLFKVRVNGIEYKPSVASPNKKQAKAEAATICLQALGVLPP